MAIGNGVLNLRESIAAANARASNGEAAQDRKPSQFWLNVGITLEGAGENGKDLFVSLPVGLPLDDMKPVQVRGNNENWIQLAQAKNQLLELIQKAAAGMEQGTSVEVPELSVQLLRAGGPKPATGTSESNPLVAALVGRLGTK